MMRIAIPAGLTLLLVAAFVGASGWNRGGDPEQTLVVTERELRLPWRLAPAPGEDPGLQLQIDVEWRHEPLDTRNWLTDDRLRALGFQLDVPPGAPEAAETYRRALPRVVWVVYEYGGAAWQEFERRRALRPQMGTRSMESSRLVPVDAGLDFDALKQRYPSGHLILRAVVALAFQSPSEGGPFVYGVVRELIPSTVSVPRGLRPVLDGLVRESPNAEPPTTDAIAPRYEVDLAVGRLGVPYIRAIRRLGM